MARRPGYPKEEDFAQLTLKELDDEIQRVKSRQSTAPDNAYFRRIYESRLHKLNKLRQQRLQESE